MTFSPDRKVTPLQYALDLFVENAPGRTAIDAISTDKDIGYQKNSVFARIIGLGLAARRFVDAAYFIVAQEPEIKESYEVSLSFFKWLMRYDSHNYKHFSSVIRSVKASMLEATSLPSVSVDAKGRMLEDSLEAGDGNEYIEEEMDIEAPSDEEGDWLELIGRVNVRKGRIRFRVPVELQRLVKDPENSYWTSLLIASRFTLIYSRSIYDLVQPVVDNGLSQWYLLEEVRNLPGKSWANNAEYKYFKRDYLDPAIKQINAQSDFEIAYDTRASTPGSRKKDQIRFRLRRKESAAAAKADMLNSAALFMTLDKEFGLTEKQFAQIADNRQVWTDARIEQAIEYIRFRISRGDDIRRANSYLMKALADNYRVSEADKQVSLLQSLRAEAETAQQQEVSARQVAVAASVAAANAAANQKLQDEMRAARDYFTAAEPAVRAELVRKFVSNTIGQRSISRQGLNPADITEANLLDWPSVATTFDSYVAGELRRAARSARRA